MRSSPSFWVGSDQNLTSSVHLNSLKPPVCVLYNFVKFAWTHLSSQSRSLWRASVPSNMSTATCRLVFSANLLRVHLILLPCHQQLVFNKKKEINSKTPLYTSPPRDSFMHNSKIR